MKSGHHQEEIRAWWEAVGPFDRAQLNELTARAFDELLEDEEFCESFLRYYLYGAIVGTGRAFVSRPETQEGFHHPPRHVEAKEVAKIVERTLKDAPLKTWRNWLETDPETGIKYALQDMDSDLLIAAAERYEASANDNLKAGAFLRLLAGKLEKGQVVRDRWEPNQIYNLQEAIQIDRVRYELKQMRKAVAVKGKAA